MKAIVFESKTGNTKSYAEILGQNTGLPFTITKASSILINRMKSSIWGGCLRQA